MTTEGLDAERRAHTLEVREDPGPGLLKHFAGFQRHNAHPAAEAVGAEHLKRAEQHEVAQLGVEIVAVYGSVFAQGVDIFLQQLAAEAVGKVGLGLP